MSGLLLGMVLAVCSVGSIMWLLYFHDVSLPVLVHGRTGVQCLILSLFSLLHFNIAEKIDSKVGNEHQCDHEPKLAEIQRESTATTLWNQQCKLPEPFLTINRISL